MNIAEHLELHLLTVEVAPNRQEAQYRADVFHRLLSKGFKFSGAVEKYYPLELRRDLIPLAFDYAKKHNLGIIVGGKEVMQTEMEGAAFWFYDKIPKHARIIQIAEEIADGKTTR